MFKKTLSVTFFTILIFTSSGFCEDFYVDVKREPFDISNNGTPENPWGTITEALLAVYTIDTDIAVIHVAPGTYNPAEGEIFPLLPENDIVLTGDDRETTIIDPDGEDATAIYCRNQNNITISNFTFIGGLGKTGIAG